jgi:2-C-methyl-D-erythritol 4-phosphate cytidylyltransferase
MKKAVVIVAAGSGRRMGDKMPKQFLQIDGKPILVHTLDRFRHFDPGMEIVMVLAPAQIKWWEELAASYGFSRELILTEGGPTRFDSVKNGLKQVDPDMLVGIHDAVRPLVSLGTLERSYNAALREGSGVPVIEMNESVRILDSRSGSAHMDRSRLRIVQTPQVFRSERIKQAYLQPYDPSFTDDASVYESVFGTVTLVEGNRENIKITTPLDLRLASLLMGSVE